jgi:hypothetical protein
MVTREVQVNIWRLKMISYQFSREQLCKVLADTIEMYLEYVDVHGLEPARGAMAAIDETLQGLDAERELKSLGEVRTLNQLLI